MCIGLKSFLFCLLSLSVFCFFDFTRTIFELCFILELESVNLYYKVRCVSVCGHSNVPTLTSPPILKLCHTQGYLWLPYDLTEVIKLFGVTFKQKNFFLSKKILYVIPSALLSFLPYYCHSFRITVIPSGLLSFLLYYCHSFRIVVIPSGLLSFLPY